MEFLYKVNTKSVNEWMIKWRKKSLTISFNLLLNTLCIKEKIGESITFLDTLASIRYARLIMQVVAEFYCRQWWVVGVHCFLSRGKPGDQSEEMGEDSWERDLRGCWGQREDVEVEPWFTQELGTTPKKRNSKRNEFISISLEFHSTVWAVFGERTEGRKGNRKLRSPRCC